MDNLKDNLDLAGKKLTLEEQKEYFKVSKNEYGKKENEELAKIVEKDLTFFGCYSN
jgi:hypothetical protein